MNTQPLTNEGEDEPSSMERSYLQEWCNWRVDMWELEDLVAAVLDDDDGGEIRSFDAAHDIDLKDQRVSSSELLWRSWSGALIRSLPTDHGLDCERLYEACMEFFVWGYWHVESPRMLMRVLSDFRELFELRFPAKKALPADLRDAHFILWFITSGYHHLLVCLDLYR